MSTITLSEAQFAQLLTVFTETLTKTGTIAFGETEVETRVQRPRRSNKAKSQPSAGSSASAARRFSGFFEVKTETTAAKLHKGHVFVLKTGGAMYTVTSVRRTGDKVVLGTDHPKVAEMTIAAKRPVRLCQAV